MRNTRGTAHRQRSIGLSLAAGGLSALLMAGTAGAQPADTPTPVSSAIPKKSVVPSQATVNGHAVHYAATTEEYVLRGDHNEPRATIFSVAYTANGANAASRPVIFIFNGGPGSPASGLHAELAPRVLADAKTAQGFAFVENPDSLIDAADLVFIDPVGTGYSRVLPGASGAEFWGNEEDAKATADFISGWLERYHRTTSPKFILGESYGGVRVGLTTRILSKRPQPVFFAGAILVSPSTGLRREAGSVPAAVSALPSFADVTWSHGRGSYTTKTVEEVFDLAHTFAYGPYKDALAAGDGLSETDKAKIVHDIAAFTGLSEDYILSKKLQITPADFVLELLADKGERTGLLDGRAHQPRAVTDKFKPPYNDPSSSQYTISYNPDAGFDYEFRTALGYKPVGPYVRLSLEANQHWDHKLTDSEDTVPLDLKDIIDRGAKMKIFLTVGYFDLTIPMSRPLDDFAAAHFAPGIVSSHRYPTGHGVLSDEATHHQSIGALRDFIEAAATP